MTLVLFLVGLLATAAGFVTIGFGIPINAFSLGNTLIIAGTIAVAAGLILIGLTVAIGQLKRIAEGLSGRPMPRSGRASESVETMVPPTARMTPAVAAPVRAPDLPVESLPEMFAPEPHLPEPPRMPAPPPRAPEPRFPATASEPASAPGPLDWLRAKTNSPAPKPSMPMPSMPVPSMPMPSIPMPSMPAAAGPTMSPAMAEPPMVEVQDEAPLSPRSPQRPAMPPAPEPAMEPRVWSPSRGPAAPRAEQPMPRATPQSPQPKEKEGFDLVWPDRAPPAPGGEARTEAKAEGKPVFDMPLPPIPARPERPDKRASAPPPKPAERGPAILKSGVIDGMPYTLYADGSIEAELPNGTVKFASVDALRAHLEKQS